MLAALLALAVSRLLFDEEAVVTGVVVMNGGYIDSFVVLPLLASASPLLLAPLPLLLRLVDLLGCADTLALVLGLVVPLGTPLAYDCDFDIATEVRGEIEFSLDDLRRNRFDELLALPGASDDDMFPCNGDCALENPFILKFGIDDCVRRRGNVCWVPSPRLWFTPESDRSGIALTDVRPVTLVLEPGLLFILCTLIMRDIFWRLLRSSTMATSADINFFTFLSILESSRHSRHRIMIRESFTKTAER